MNLQRYVRIKNENRGKADPALRKAKQRRHLKLCCAIHTKAIEYPELYDMVIE